MNVPVVKLSGDSLISTSKAQEGVKMDGRTATSTSHYWKFFSLEKFFLEKNVD